MRDFRKNRPRMGQAGRSVQFSNHGRFFFSFRSVRPDV
jgi:hypothetical protein